MFKLFKNKNKKIILPTKKSYIKPELSKLFEISENNGITKLEIMEDHKLSDFCNYTVQLENDNLLNYNLKALNLRHIIHESGDIFTALLYKQTTYFFKNNNKDYVISISNNIIKISERELIDKNTYESTLDIEFDKNQYCIGKYIHDEWMSTSYNKWYPDGIMQLEEVEAIEATQSLLNNLQNIDLIENIISLDKIYDFLENNTNWNLSKNKSQNRF